MAAGDPGSPARYYSSTAVETSLQSSIAAQAQGASNTSFIVASISGFPADFPFTLIVDPDTSKEEVVTVTSGSSTTLTVTRGADNTQGVAHTAGAVVRHGVSGRDFRESQTHIAARGYDTDSTLMALANQTHVHGLATGDGVVVGTTKAQTLTNKTLENPIITGVVGNASLVFEGATADAHETTFDITDPTADRTITFPDASGNIILNINKVTDLAAPTTSFSMNSQKITSLATPTLNTDAANKSYVDAILVLQEASAASSATSASMAATSATSAATSASSALTSANSASSSASAAATSATSAAASVTAAGTSATSAAASATAAATSASSAAASYDEFDDRYLGDKSSDPTVDNDGNPLLTGALYFNTVLPGMKVYTGSAWDIVAPDTANFVDKAIWTAKGTLIAADGPSSPVALTVAATDGYVLTVSSATTTGLAWTAPNPGDITGVTAGTGLTGGGTSGAVTVSLDTTSVYVVPSQSGQTGKYLTTDGTSASWATVEAGTDPLYVIMGAY